MGDEAKAFLFVPPLDGSSVSRGHVYYALQTLVRVDCERKNALPYIPDNGVGEGSGATYLDLFTEELLRSDSGIERRPPLTGARVVLYHSLKDYSTSMPRCQVSGVSLGQRSALGLPVDAWIIPLLSLHPLFADHHLEDMTPSDPTDDTGHICIAAQHPTKAAMVR